MAGLTFHYLFEHGLRHRRKEDIRSKYNQALCWSIDQQPEIITQRGCIGDFEIDTVVGPHGYSKVVLLTLLDRKSRFFWVYLLKDRTVSAVNETLSKFIFIFKGSIHSLTMDHGTEFSGLDVFETQYGYCHAYSPAERGSNERFNRILRYFCPKGTCFEHVSAQELRTTLL